MELGAHIDLQVIELDGITVFERDGGDFAGCCCCCCCNGGGGGGEAM